MSYAKPIWTEVEACTYKSSKSWGAIDTCSFRQYVGSSAKNSHLQCSFITTKRFNAEDDTWIFKTSINDVILIVTRFKNNRGRPGDIIDQIDRTKDMKQ